MRYIELVMRPPSDVITLKPLRGMSCFLDLRSPPVTARSHSRPLAAVTQSPTSPAERRSTAKPAQEAISTLRGEGTRGTAGSRGQVWGRVRGRLQTILPQRRRSPNLACKMRPRHAARVQRPSGQIPRGHTARNPGESDDTLAHEHARASYGHPATHANPDRNADSGVSALRMSALHSPAIVALCMVAWSRHGSPNPALVLVPGRCHCTSPLGII